MIRDIILQLSVRSIRVHFLRSVLAALGIVIGVVAIAAMGMMGANMTLSVTESLSATANILTVTEYTGGGGPGGGFSSLGGGGGSSAVRAGSSSASEEFEDTISDLQYRDLQKAAGKYGLVYPLYQTQDTFSIGEWKGRAGIYGMDPDVIPEVLTLEEGTYPMTTSEILVGPNIADRFGLAVGNRLTIGKEGEAQQKVRVVGILRERGMSFDMNTDNAIIIVEKLYIGLYGGEGKYNQVNIVLDDIKNVNATKEAIDAQLNRKETVVSVRDSSRMLETVTSTLGTITTFVMSIAGISLLVAAVSIFNVMLMSVTERIHEIGILRSIGTQKNEILRMFIYEAAILGFVGAAIGAITSLGIGYLVVLAMVGSTQYFFAWGSLSYIPLAMAVGLVVCLFSGVYPAWKASNLDPIEALRAE
jgi:putative ABC transport system permease protein